MSHDPIATRYARTLFEAAKAEGQIEPTLQQLTLIGGLLHDHPDLRQFLLNPDVGPDDKVGLFDRVLRQSWSELVRAFIRMVVSLDRAESLAEMVDAFQEAVDADQGRVRVLVRSARPLSDALLGRLRTRLEHRERKQIELATEIVPALLGGLQLFLGNRVIDDSIQRQLTDLREQLSTVKVY